MDIMQYAYNISFILTYQGYMYYNKCYMCYKHTIQCMPGSGSFCPLPFTFDRVMYDTCTRAKVDGTPNKVESFYWCPSPEYVDKDKNNLFPGHYAGYYGKCHEFMRPPGKEEEKENEEYIRVFRFEENTMKLNHSHKSIFRQWMPRPL